MCCNGEMIYSNSSKVLLLTLTVLLQTLLVECASWTDVTANVFIGTGVNEGILAAFGDFNADKNTGLFVISSDNKQVHVLEAQGEHVSYSRKHLLTIGQGNITSVVPADYDGDSKIDVLITNEEASRTTVHIYWGNGSSVSDIPYDITETFVEQPLVFDFNGDMLPDVLGESGESGSERIVWVASSNRNFTKQTFTDGKVNNTFLVPHSNTFIDLNDDLTADLLLTTTTGYEVWLNQKGKFVHNNTIQSPSLGQTYGYIGQVSFADLDQDSKPEMLLPVCEDKECTKSKILMYINETNTWHVLIEKFKDNNNMIWGFVNPDTLDGTFESFKLPVTLRMGDYNMDGFPDMVVILRNTKDGKRRAFVVNNVPCSGSECSPGQRTFSVVWDDQAPMQVLDTTVAAAFFDLYENGILDIALVSLAIDKIPHIFMFENGFDEDAVFVKVAVTSGICNAPCSKPFAYGVNSPGPVIKYHTTKYDGSLMKSCATQLSQSAHYALQLPYTVFGLGLTANFLDALNVGIPGAPGKGVRSHEWTSIIPNSQMIVIPYPHDTPSSWKKRLFVTPGRLVLLTGAALAGTCGFMAAIVGILHWREKREDEKEKRQEAHRFHFDAM